MRFRTKHAPTKGAFRFSMLGVFSTALLTMGCGPTTQQASVQVPTLKVNTKAPNAQELKKEGITVSVTPITLANAKQFPQVYKTFTWQDSILGRAAQTHQDIELIVPPGGTFEVRILNHSGHVIKLTEVVFRLEDNAKRRYPLFSDAKDLTGWNEAALAAEPTGSPDPAENLMKLQRRSALSTQVPQAVSGLQLLSRTVELLNGDEWTGYAAFNVNVNSAKDYYKFMEGISRLTFRMAEVPVELDPAGKPSKTTEFTFYVDKTTDAQTMTCPINATPSVEVCRTE